MVRFFVFVLALIMLNTSCLAESPSERLSQLDIILQWEDRFQTERYYYYNAMFFEQGCLPASVCNALTALLGTPETSADDRWQRY